MVPPGALPSGRSPARRYTFALRRVETECSTMEFRVVDMGLPIGWRWQILEDGQGESRIVDESADHKSETACRDELDRLIDACRKDRRPNPVFVTHLV